MAWPHNLILEANKILEHLHNANVEPSKEDALRFLRVNPLKIKVVILGQDPYPTPGVANGRAFAVNQNVSIPRSLSNIFQEITEIYGKVQTDRTLESWEKQGVLLLNTSLTVKVGNPNSHKKYWLNFMLKLLKWIDSNLEVVWVLWGNEAKKFSYLFQNFVIEDVHPSPFSFKNRKKITFKQLDFISW